MNDHHPDSLRLLARQQHEQRLRVAGAERLARELPRTPQRRWRLRLRISPASAVSGRADPGRLET